MLPFCLKAQYVVLEKILKHNLFKLDKLWATIKKEHPKRCSFFMQCRGGDLDGVLRSATEKY